MNILLTGGAGYIGSHTAISLIDAGYKVIILDNFSNSEPSVIYRIQKITGKSIIFIEGDLRDFKLVSNILKDNSIHAVIHLGGLKAVAESVKNPIDYFDNNVKSSITLLQAMIRNGIKKIVFSSSATVYGVPKYLPYDENHPTSSINPYGRTKIHIEEMLKDLTNSDPEWSAITLRYFNPVGAHKSGALGEAPKGIPNNLMPYLVRVASGQIGALNIFGNDYETRDGTGERDYIHVEDLAEGHVAALQFIFLEKGWHAINLGTGKSTSVLELVHTFEKVTNKKISINFTSRREGDLPSYYAKASKAKKILNWEARRDLEDMCLSAWRSEETRRS
ncbi:UDP-glucose 4-epimerase GalE [Candidatus Methylopumilus planktonicus]|uniref:UDP-glucose 4-epimerase GalE n=1 Tax=Candidatus Methylopumilus planktonicus TaxID=1581557 RepID=UPI00112206EF|nr:UDP-glucose 4-epimerase GalE [Candidatus Methylopumilus planktonicus]QDD01808.1 UDP-glucose 4-epimerase GalE [Candidatus Methylopumilus planktonicus]